MKKAIAYIALTANLLGKFISVVTFGILGYIILLTCLTYLAQVNKGSFSGADILYSNLNWLLSARITIQYPETAVKVSMLVAAAVLALLIAFGEDIELKPQDSKLVQSAK